jgi:uncharacterized protein
MYNKFIIAILMMVTSTQSFQIDLEGIGNLSEIALQDGKEVEFINNDLAKMRADKSNVIPDKNILSNRPQEPFKPYPYSEEEVTFESKVAGVTLAGILTKPRKIGSFPTVILIAGAGPHTRDAIKSGHKTFLVLADYLTRHGIGVLRFDKRGCGESTGKYTTATTMDFADDAKAAIEYLKSRRDIDPKRIGLIGYSEGGIIASIIAAKSNDIAFVVLIGTPAVSGEDLLSEWCRLISKAENASTESIAKGMKFISNVFNIVKEENNANIAKAKIDKAYEEYLSNLTEEQRSVAQDSIFYETAQMGDNFNWLKFFNAFNPVQAIRKIKIPLLALFSETDVYVSAKQNKIPCIKALEESGNKDYTVIQFPDLNHRFQVCKICTEKEYEDIEETMSPEVLKTIVQWIWQKQRKNNK